MSKISVLVPVYGVEAYIERCSRSLFEQTCSDLEYVFVDDCSLDRSIDVLRSVMKDYPFKEHCVKIIRHNKNRGLAAARNTLLDNATGEFVCFVDSDDWLENNAIQTLIDKQHETNADMVWGCKSEHRIDGVETISYPNLEKSKRILLNLDGDYMPLSGNLIRKSLFDKNAIRWMDGFDMAEDVRMVCLLSYFADKMFFCDSPTYHYDKTNPTSIMKESQDKNKALKNAYDNLQNKLSVLEFFSNKEKQYYDKAVGMVVRQLEIVLKQSLKRRNRRVFCDLVNIIDRNSDVAKKLYLKHQGLEFFVLHNYVLSEMVFQVSRLTNKIKRIL